MRLRKKKKKMKNDPLTIIIALDLENKSSGIIYFDDEESLDYQKEEYSLLKIKYEKYQIDFEWIKYNYHVINKIEKIIILGENEQLIYSKEIKPELINIKNNKYNLEITTDFENKNIVINRLNKYKLIDIQKITFQ